jgi:hypothetical protein
VLVFAPLESTSLRTYARWTRLNRLMLLLTVSLGGWALLMELVLLR